MSTRLNKLSETRTVVYNCTQWDTLKKLREKAVAIMKILEPFYFQSYVHGSVARGDVKETSDVDVYIPEVQNSFIVESALEKAKIPINSRFIVQATPMYTMKAHIEIDEYTSVSFPLMKMRLVEREFYRFGGEASLDQLSADKRVLGVDKRLMLIEPTKNGHTETGIIGREDQIAKILGISSETVLDRVHALIKRDATGRTGVFIKKELEPDETFELALKKLCDRNAAVRRRMKKGA